MEITHFIQLGQPFVRPAIGLAASPPRHGMPPASLTALHEFGDIIGSRALHPARESGRKFGRSEHFDGNHWQELVDETERLNLAGGQGYVTQNAFDTSSVIPTASAMADLCACSISPSCPQQMDAMSVEEKS